MLARAFDRLSDLRRLPVVVRVAKHLSELAGADEGPAHIFLRQSDLAKALGVSRMSVIQALKALTENGLVAARYGKIEIPNPPNAIPLNETERNVGRNCIRLRSTVYFARLCAAS